MITEDEKKFADAAAASCQLCHGPGYRFMYYDEAIDYLRELTKFGFNFGLERTVELLRRIGDPHKRLRCVHVGGTNGKGSVSAMIAAMLTAAGHKTGLYTSPHIHSYRERFRVDNVEAGRGEICNAISNLRPVIQAMVRDGFEHPTEFEVNTALAFQYFAVHRVDYAVLEVGLGGEIDATNVLEKPEVVVLTNVALEHTEYLGHTKEEILGTKSGIVKAGCHLLSGLHEPELQAQLRAKATEVGAADVGFGGLDFVCQPLSDDGAGQHFDYTEGGEAIFHDLFLPLLGAHQLRNGALAIRAARLLGLNEDAIRQGLAATAWPCRLEKVADAPLTILDGAHNDHGMAVLAEYVRTHLREKPIVLVIGMLADKEREKAVALIGPLVQRVVITKPNNPRAGDFAAVAGFFAPYCSRIEIVEEIADACDRGRALATELDATLLITGSLYMVCDARAHILGIETE